MPILEKYEVQQNRIWYRVEVTEEQKAEYLKWQSDIMEADERAWAVGVTSKVNEEPKWLDDLDWDHHYDKPGNDEVISMEIVDE